VKISLKGKVVAESDDGGFFSVPLGNCDESRVALTFNAEGYVANTRVYNSKAQGMNVVVIWPIAYRLKFDPSCNLDVELGSSRIQVPANALTGPNGTKEEKKLNEMVELRFTWFDVTSPSQRAAAPGDFTGQLLDGSIRRLNSYGIFDFDLRNLKGQSLRLRRGAGINLSIAVPPRLARKAPKQVGFFIFEPLVGNWIQLSNFDFAPSTLTYNGSVTRVPGAFNTDDPQETTCVTIRVVREWDSAPMPNAIVTVDGLSYVSTGTTNANGLACVLVQRNACFSVTAYVILGTSHYMTPLPTIFCSPDFMSGASDCGDPCKCPLLGEVRVDLIVGLAQPLA
jgi:hypothetical protein